ncbi:histidinol-phosphate transaminase [Kocuria sp. WN036]|uniref:histidinol-phosphate transaminase n=1 Tax=Kocuria TaxID=57493 RepID=UPI0003620B92|nr:MULTISPECIES: histidinol-phosphate transaminase [Kocuria]EYT51526.1 aminotransferase [Kocuria sp. UCD-OTCP]MCC5784188.1 histidinol-phosphate transaminase [Kocuria sp. CCUG 69068]NVC23018.1 aminotransferase class I/II-fold pyridoxal phosphate-dependent enzyme [Kocuria salina]PAU91757.1 histidinol-phosphate transaminase [Kocuria sp. WN036]
MSTSDATRTLAGTAPASGPATATTPAVRPRPALSRLPRYAAGKPPVVVDGLVSYKLSSNENPFGPVPAVKEVLAGWDAVHRYPETTSAELREVLGEFLGVPAEDIVTGAGSLGALNQLLGAFVGAGEDGTPDEVVHAWRSFEAYPISIGLSGGLGVPVPNRRDGSHDLEAMAAAVTARTKVVLLCTPNNPTGPSLTTAQVEEFLAAVPRDVIVVIDEAYQEFQRRDDLVDGVDLYRRHPNVVVLRTFSKAHGLAGLRIGYSVARQEITQYLRQASPAFSVTDLAQRAAIASVRHYDQVAERVQRVVDERERVLAGLDGLGWPYPQTQANFVWLNLGEHSGGFAELCDAHALSVRRFGDEGVRVTIGEPEANTRFLELCAQFPHPPVL